MKGFENHSERYNNKNPVRPCKIFPIAVLRFYIFNRDSYDSRLSFCCFPGLTIDSGTFTHMAWCSPLLALTYPSGSPAQLQQVEPQGRFPWVSRQDSKLGNPLSCKHTSASPEHFVLMDI